MVPPGYPAEVGGATTDPDSFPESITCEPLLAEARTLVDWLSFASRLRNREDDGSDGCHSGCVTCRKHIDEYCIRTE